MNRAYIDTDVILDLLQIRHPFHEDASSLLALIEKGKLKGFVSPFIFADLFYILRKDHDNKGAVDRLIRLKMLLKIVTIGERTIELALSSSFTDFEDAIQYFAALDCKADCLVTRNKRDFKGSKIPVFLPGELLRIVCA
jgi:predicted nucleic acid-binding protein